MAKRIISQARGKGSFTYRVRRKAYRHKIAYPPRFNGEGEVVKLVNSAGHTTPLAKIKYGKKGEIFFIPASYGISEGQKINLGDEKFEVKNGNISRLKFMPVKTKVFNVESRQGDGGKFVRTGGSSALVSKVVGGKVYLIMPSKKEKAFNGECRATVGVCAGHGRVDKPFVKAGRKHYIKKAKNKLWPRTSAVKMNAIDHPFGSGRGKNPKSKIAKRNAPPGKRVGLLRPARTGRKKR